MSDEFFKLASQAVDELYKAGVAGDLDKINELYRHYQEDIFHERLYAAIDDYDSSEFINVLNDERFHFSGRIGMECYVHLFMKATEKGLTDCCRRLMEKGLDVDKTKTGMRGEVPLIFAARNNKPEIVSLLIAHGCGLNSQDDYENGAIHYAASAGYIDVVKMLVENGCDIELKGYEGRTALLGAATSFKFDIAIYLLERGADSEVQTEYGSSLIDILSKKQGAEGLMKAIQVVQENKLLNGAINASCIQMQRGVEF